MKNTLKKDKDAWNVDVGSLWDLGNKRVDEIENALMISYWWWSETQVKTLNLINQYQNGQTPLHVALSRSHVDIALLLIAKDASFSAQDNVRFPNAHLKKIFRYVSLLRWNGVETVNNDVSQVSSKIYILNN